MIGLVQTRATPTGFNNVSHYKQQKTDYNVYTLRQQLQNHVQERVCGSRFIKICSIERRSTNSLI